MNLKLFFALALSIFILSFLFSCAGIPKNAKPVENFEAKRYLGAWYEMARLDYKFERNMDNVVAQYSMKDNGEIKVFNSGYNTKKEKWTSAKGSAKFTENEKIAALKVSFFKPFYGGYNVIAIDPNYKYALVAGSNLKYLWLLSREKTMPEEIKQQYLKLAKEVGYDTSNLIWVAQDKNNPNLSGK